MDWLLMVLALPLLIWQLLKGGSWNTPQVKLGGVLFALGLAFLVLGI
jgi:hypothetical protein